MYHVFFRLKEDGEPIFCWRPIPDEGINHWRVPDSDGPYLSRLLVPPSMEVLPTDIACGFKTYLRKEVLKQNKSKRSVFVEENIDADRLKDILREHF